MPSPCSASSHAISVKAFRWRIWGKNSLGPRDPKRIRRAEYSLWTGSLFGGKNSKEREGKWRGGREAFSLFPLPSSPLDQRPVDRLRGIMRPMRWTRQRQTVLFRYSPSLSLKTLDTGISLLAVFKLLSLACVQSPPPQQTPRKDTPSPIFFWGEGAAVHRLSETDNPSSNYPPKLTDKVRRILHSKLKSFHFQIKTRYLSDSNYQTDNPSHTNNPFLVWKRPFLL